MIIALPGPPSVRLANSTGRAHDIVKIELTEL